MRRSRKRHPFDGMTRAMVAYAVKLIAGMQVMDCKRRLLDSHGQPPKTRQEFKHRALLQRLQDLQAIGVVSGDRITAQSFQRFQNVGLVTNLTVAGENGTPLQLQTPEPIVNLHFFLTLTTTESSASGVVEDAVNRWFRILNLSHGGDPIITLGDGSAGSSAPQMLEPTVRGWLKSVPHLTQVADGGNTALVHTMVPISVPVELYNEVNVNRSALRIGQDSTWFIRTRAGQLADLFSTVGDLAVTVASVEVVAEINEDLDARYPGNAFHMESNFENLSLLTAGTRRRVILSADGTQLFLGFQQRENSLRSRTILTNLELRYNGSQQVSEGSWNLYEWQLEHYGDQAANAPVGMASALLDNQFDLGGIPASAATGWDALLANSAGTNAESDGLNIQSFYILDGPPRAKQ